MRTSYKKNRPFDFKLIDHVEPNTLLYKRQTGLSNYDMMKAKTEAWTKIAEIMECDVDFCLMRWNNLHYQYRKESRRVGGSTWPYFERLKFLSRIKANPQEQQQPTELQKVQEIGEDAWQSYDDCVVMQVSEIEQQADSTFVIEEIIESTHDQMLHEEIIYEEQQLRSPANDYLQMNSILQQLQGKHKKLAERRILAFALKCQLRALVNEPIDDLVI